MVGVVAVSHSRPLADAAVALARQMAGPRVRIEVAAGLADDVLGTDAVAVAAAMAAADDGDGVLVLMDLGSAVLSADLARELVDDATRARVVLSPGPFVEGLVVAAVAASTGAPLAEVAEQAGDALSVKRSNL